MKLHDQDSTLIVRAKDSAGRTQMAEGHLPDGGTVTPNENFFIVHHYDAVSVSEGEFSLEVRSGRESQHLSLADLKALPFHSVTAVTECAGMSRGFLPQRTPGTQFGNGLVGTASWAGVRLGDVLRSISADEDFETVVVHARDAGTTMPENEHSDFSKGIPREKAMHEDTLLAFEMNGTAVPELHGGPVRLVVPGWFGVWWVKWPRLISTGKEAEYNGFWQSRRYTYQNAEGKMTGVVKWLLPRSIVVSPPPFSHVRRGKLEISGLAWSGEHPVDKVEITTDGGNSWALCEIAERSGRWSWVRWRGVAELNAPTGMHAIASRATDEAGRSQQWASSANRLGYANNGIQSALVSVTV